METKTQGSFRNVTVPRSSIYVSEKGVEPVKEKYKFESNVSSFHFFLIMTSGQGYTQEDIKAANGKYSCFNCCKKIMGQIYFYPEKFDPQTNEAACNPTPHCGLPCLYRTVQDISNNTDLLTNLFLMYGQDFVCAPPRFLLFVPGGLTVEEYAQVSQDSLVIQNHESHIRGIFAPVYLSCTLFKDHQLVPDTVAMIDTMEIPDKKTIGPSRTRNNADLKVLELQTKKLMNTNLSQIFEFETASFGRNEDMNTNPHMQK